MRLRRPHVHTGHRWDGWYEHCRCGACAGDRRDEHGNRHIAFADWPDDARTAPTEGHTPMGKKLAPLGLLLLVVGGALALGTGDWRWAVYGLLALAAYGAVCATVDNFRRSRADDERSDP